MVISGKQNAILCLTQAAETKTWWRAKWGRSQFGMMGLCVCCFFLITTTMKVGCAEALGTLEQCLLATAHCYAPIHTTSITQCLMYLETNISTSLAELWLKRQKKKKSIKCAYLAKGFSNELYICNYASVSQRALFVIFRVWKSVNLWCLPSAGKDSQSV